MTVFYNYMGAIGTGFPLVQCHCLGDGSIYDNIVWDAGDPIPSQADLDAWMDAQTKADMWILIRNERDRRKSAGGYKVGNYWFHSDDISRIQQLALVIMGTNMPSGIMWKTLSGEFTPMTPTLAMQIFQTASTSDINIFSIAEQKNSAMIASADPGSYDWRSGWPLIYGE